MLQDDALVSSKAGGRRREEIAPSAQYRVSTSLHAFPALNLHSSLHSFSHDDKGEKPYLI